MHCSPLRTQMLSSHLEDIHRREGFRELRGYSWFPIKILSSLRGKRVRRGMEEASPMFLTRLSQKCHLLIERVSWRRIASGILNVPNNERGQNQIILDSIGHMENFSRRNLLVVVCLTIPISFCYKT